MAESLQWRHVWALTRRAFLALPCAAAGWGEVALLLEKRPRDGWRLSRRYTGCQVDLLSKLNRADRRGLAALGQIVVPEVWDENEREYGPFWRWEEALGAYPKALIADLGLQALGAYEDGELVHWGPISSGTRIHPTPPGAYHLNWKSRGRRSTVNPEWYLPYSFNFDSREGLSLHAYALPGRPASHSCIRLLEPDARWLYEWGEQWMVDENDGVVVRNGTPLWIEGQYAFGSPPPWISARVPRRPRSVSGHCR